MFWSTSSLPPKRIVWGVGSVAKPCLAGGVLKYSPPEIVVPSNIVIFSQSCRTAKRLPCSRSKSRGIPRRSRFGSAKNSFQSSWGFALGVIECVCVCAVYACVCLFGCLPACLIYVCFFVYCSPFMYPLLLSLCYDFLLSVFSLCFFHVLSFLSFPFLSFLSLLLVSFRVDC